MHAVHPQNSRVTVFRDGLRDSLTACSKVLTSPSYLEYLRTAFLQERDVLRIALYSGHGALCELVRSFLEESARNGIIRDLDFQFEAECLLAQAQGFDFVYALLCQQAAQPALIQTRIEAAVSTFCRANVICA